MRSCGRRRRVLRPCRWSAKGCMYCPASPTPATAAAGKTRWPVHRAAPGTALIAMVMIRPGHPSPTLAATAAVGTSRCWPIRCRVSAASVNPAMSRWDQHARRPNASARFAGFWRRRKRPWNWPNCPTRASRSVSDRFSGPISSGSFLRERSTRAARRLVRERQSYRFSLMRGCGDGSRCAAGLVSAQRPPRARAISALG